MINIYNNIIYCNTVDDDIMRSIDELNYVQVRGEWVLCQREIGGWDGIEASEQLEQRLHEREKERN